LEEFGGVGSSHFEFENSPAYVITIDRKGINDIVTEISDIELMEKELKNRILKIAKKHKRKSVTGLFADCLNYTKDGYASMNVSCGYYNPHTLQEYVSFQDMKKTELLILDILNSIPLKEYISGKVKIKFIEKYNSFHSKGFCVFCGNDKAYYDNYYDACFCDECIIKFNKNDI